MSRILGDASVLGAAREATLVIGAFDGVHLGHQALLAQALVDARELGTPLVAVTFDPDPSELFLKERAEKRLLAPTDRAKALVQAGADACVLFDFTYELAALSPEDFIDHLCGMVKPVSVHVGRNFHFGAKGAGDVGTLQEIGRARGFATHVADLLELAGERVSATRIRGLIERGKVEDARVLLTRRHFLRGRVVHGRGEGTGFGFATANVELSSRDCLPAEGVYGGYAVFEDGSWPAAINVGAPKSFDGAEGQAFAEAHLIGFAGDLYNRELALSFESWIREPRVFDSLDELISVVEDNIGWVQDNIRAPFQEVRVDFA